MPILAVFVAFLLVGCARAESCPTHTGEASEESILHGRLLYHDDLRQWLGVKLDQVACGQREIQLVFADSGALRKAKALRGCAVTVNGKLYESPTGYYSAPLAMSDARLSPDPSCHPSPVDPDLSIVSIPQDVRTYNVSITIDYHGKGHVQVRVWRDQKKQIPLNPWQAYAHYLLTGGQDFIWFGCRAGFRLSRVALSPRSQTESWRTGRWILQGRGST